MTPPRLGDREFVRLAEFVQTTTGIRMPPNKRVLLETRLTRRLRALGLSGFSEYCELVLDRDDTEERVLLVDEVTTNKTEFFREPQHFDALLDIVTKRSEPAPFRIWSAGCATGEEPYSIAITLAEHALSASAFAFEVTASDLCTGALNSAREAVYEQEALRALPDSIRDRYFMRGVGRMTGKMRVVPSLRSKVRFAPVNLLADAWDFGHKFDAIFCCNVLIYFERPTQIEVLSRLCSQLAPGGHLFVGHSETLHGMGLPLRFVCPTVYRRDVL